MGVLRYSSNNSGGGWWLTDQNWLDMEAAGWKVDWVKDSTNEWRKGDRWLGALATSAEIETDDPDQTIAEWEALTGENADDEGCNCCGQPHYFSFEDGEERRTLTSEVVAVRRYWN